MHTRNLVVGITGGSGAIYATRFLKQAVRHYDRILLIMSDQAFQVLQTEMCINLDRKNFSTKEWLGAEYASLAQAPTPNPQGIRSKNPKSKIQNPKSKILLLDPKSYFTPPASGSFRHVGMVIVPCSMGTAGRIANGISDDLITRSADVCLKEGRKLILVPREMPWNLIMLRNLTQLAEAGATILPASPAWYGRPRTLEELSDTVVARILQNLGIEQDVVGQWMESD